MAEQKYDETRVSVNHCSSAQQFLGKMAQTGSSYLLDVSEYDIFGKGAILETLEANWHLTSISQSISYRSIDALSIEAVYYSEYDSFQKAWPLNKFSSLQTCVIIIIFCI